MQLKIQKRLAARHLKVSKKKIWLDANRLDDIKEAITTSDVKSLIKDKAIKARKITGVSRVRARKRQLQKKKGRRTGAGSVKSSKNARIAKKIRWINRIRIQRKFLRRLRNRSIINKPSYRSLYLKSKGGFFRSKRHLKMYMEEHGFLTDGKK